ncbi:unnamed protein product [Penicillium salamii]|nr:unnamed protein product [Penicillium salamii]CAG8208410.1 unnamed protein product [Penicillium salamii]CAG8413294.1 unnamed protein product [Penicillium salamii]
MVPHEREVLVALKLIHDTPIEILNVHREFALQTWRQVGRVLSASRKGNDPILTNGDLNPADTLLETMTASEQLPFCSNALNTTIHIPNDDATTLPAQEICTSSENDPISLPPASSCSTHEDQSHTRKRKRQNDQPDNVSKLIKAATRHVPELVEFCKLKASLSEVLQSEQEMQFADKRIDHLKQVDGNRSPSNEQKLLKGLSQLSLAHQFTIWEEERGWKPRADMLFDKFQAASQEAGNQLKGAKCSGKISRFVRDHGYPEADHNVVRKGIQRGTIQMVFRRLMCETFPIPEQHAAIEGIVALLTIFEYSLFQSLSIRELPVLTNLWVKDNVKYWNPSVSSCDNPTTSTFSSFRVLSKWFKNMTVDFEMISRNNKRTRPKTPLIGLETDTAGQIRDCQSDSTAYPSTESHDLSSFSTFPLLPNDRRLSISAFVEQQIPGEYNTAQNQELHDLAHFARYTDGNSPEPRPYFPNAWRIVWAKLNLHSSPRCTEQ